jgi:acetyl-CoA acyltransferase
MPRVVLTLGIADDAPPRQPQRRRDRTGHPLGASGARLVTTAVNPLHRVRGRHALCTMCIGVGQGTAVVIERA